jgi:hypothetical protein
MIASRKIMSGLTVAFALGALAAGCGDIGFGSGAKEALLGKPMPTPDIADRPKLAMPPANAALPVPGQALPARPAWATGTQDPNKQASAAPAETAAAKTEDKGWFSGLFGSKTQ